MQLASHFPDMKSMMSQALEAKYYRDMAQRLNGCFVCGKRGMLKACRGCDGAVRYCSR